MDGMGGACGMGGTCEVDGMGGTCGTDGTGAICVVTDARVAVGMGWMGVYTGCGKDKCPSILSLGECVGCADGTLAG